MNHSEKIAPVGALGAALLSIACCVPFGITASAGLAGISTFASRYQLWLLGGSVLLLIVGVLQLLRNPACRRRSRASIVLLSVSAVIVVAVTVFPQAIAGFIADRIP